MMFMSNQEKANLILVLHPDKEKNLDILEVYNKFAGRNLVTHEMDRNTLLKSFNMSDKTIKKYIFDI